jgi:hypothetical protein
MQSNPDPYRASILMTRKGGGMNAPAKASTIDPLLHPKEVAGLLNVSGSWLAKSRLTGTGPRYMKAGRAVRYPANLDQ